VVGFGLVVGLSVLPWTKFGDSSGLLRAWTLHWSLLAVVAAVVGLGAAVATWRRPRDPRVEAASQVGLALVVGIAAFLHYQRPPPLSAPSLMPVLAMLAAGLAATSGIIKAGAMIRLRRPAAV